MKQLVNLFARQVKQRVREAERGSLRRRLRSEALEKRQLLAGDLLPAHNYAIPEDVNGDWEVTPLDALLILNHISRSGGNSSLEAFQRGELEHFVDVTGNNEATPLDALRVMNRIARGEAQSELVQLHVNPRTAEDQAFTASAFNAATRQLTVGVNEIFNLEILYTDLRGTFDRLGAFAIYTDVLFDQPGILEPVLTETQYLTVSGNLRQADGGTLVFSLQGAPGETVTVDFEDFALSPELTIRNAVQNLGFNNVTVTALPSTDANDPFTYIIRFNDFALANQDIPNLVVQPQLVGSTGTPLAVTASVEDVTPRINGQINPAAVPLNINFLSRTFKVSPQFPQGEPFYGFAGTQVGSFNPASGFIDVGATGPLLINGYPDAGAGNVLPRPFDAFSLPVRLTQEVQDFRIFLDPPNTSATQILLYGSPSQVPNDLIRIDTTVDPNVTTDGTGVLFVTAVSGQQVVVNAPDLTRTATQGGAAVTLPIRDLITVQNGNAATASVQIVTPPNIGTATVDAATGVITFTPPADQSGTATFVYSATVGGVTDEGTVTVTVSPQQVVTVDAPDLNRTATQGGAPVTIDLRSAVTVQGSTTPATIAIVTPPTLGTVSVNAQGVATYTPPAGQSGTTTFVYSATVNGVTDNGTVTVTVSPEQVVTVNAPDLSRTAVQGGAPVSIDLRSAVTVEGSTTPATIAIVTPPTLGTVTVNAQGVATYTPPAGQSGTTTFVYSATVNGVTDNGTVTVTVSPQQVVTVTAPDLSRTAQQGGAPVSIDLRSAVTVEGSTTPPTIAIVTPPTLGTVTVNAQGVATYTPPAGQSGTTTFVYSATVNGVTDNGTVTVTVSPQQVVTVNAPDLTRTAQQGGAPVSIDLRGAVTVQGSTTPATIAIVTPPTLGTVSVNAQGVATYTPPTGQSGTATFVYSATVNGVTDTGTVTVTVSPLVVTVNAPDLTRNAFPGGPAVSIDLRSAVTVQNSTTPPTITIVTPPTLGTVTVNAQGVATYTPPAEQTGTATFVYRATVNGVSDTGTVTINVTTVPLSSISGSIFTDYVTSPTDLTRNGVRDAHEPAVGGVTVRLSSTELGVSQERLTDGQGNYSFANLVPGRYTVTFDVPDTLIFGSRVNSSGLAVNGSQRSFVVDIPAEGGQNFAGLNFTVLGRTGAAAGSSNLLVSQYTHLNPDAPQNASNPNFGTAIMVLDSSGSQQLFELGRGNENILFTEIAVNNSGTSAVLTVIRESGVIQSAILDEDDFFLSPNGSVVYLLRNINTLSFIDASQEQLTAEYGQYRASVDRYFANNF